MKQGPKVAVHQLSFAVSKGDCFGFLGINGAGKWACWWISDEMQQLVYSRSQNVLKYHHPSLLK